MLKRLKRKPHKKHLQETRGFEPGKEKTKGTHGIFKYSKEKKIQYSFRNNWYGYKQADGSPTV